MTLTPQQKRIRIEMIKNDVISMDIARELGVSSPLVSMTIKGERNNPHIQQAIAIKVGRPVAELFAPSAARRE